MPDHSDIIRSITLLIRRAGLDYDAARYVWAQVRRRCDLRPARKEQSLPRIMDTQAFRRLFDLIDREAPALHRLLLRCFFFSGLRVAELCRLERTQIDWETGRVSVVRGKGAKDRSTLLPQGFLLALRVHLDAHPAWRYVFQTTRHGPFTPRRVQQIVQKYAQQAGVTCTPHTLRHQFVSWLTAESGLSDAELQLLTGHSNRKTLEIYQHLALNESIVQRYNDSMKKVDL